MVTGPITARVPILQRIADLAMLPLILPILLLGWTMALMLPAVLIAIAAGFGDEMMDRLIASCVIAASVPSILVAWRRLVWWLRVENDQIVLGPAWPRIRLPCRDIEMIRVGSLSQRLRGDDDPLHVPVLLSGKSRHQLMLDPAGANRLLEQLLQVCPNAAGISLEGKETLPRNPAARTRGAKRLRRFWLWSGSFALVLSAVIILALLVAISGDDTFAKHTEKKVIFALYLFVTMIPSLGYGLFALRRAR